MNRNRHIERQRGVRGQTPIPAPTSPIRLAPSNISTSISGYCMSATARTSPPIPAPLRRTRNVITHSPTYEGYRPAHHMATLNLVIVFDKGKVEEGEK